MKLKLVEQITGINRDTWLSILIMHLMTEHTANADNWGKKFGLTFKPGEPGDDEIELKITINGVEVKFESFIKHLESQYTAMLREAAKELIEERSRKLIDRVEEAERLLNDEIEKSFPGRTVW